MTKTTEKNILPSTKTTTESLGLGMSFSPINAHNDVAIYWVFQKKRTPWFILTITFVNMDRF